MENTGQKRKKGPELEEPLAKKAKKSKHGTKDRNVEVNGSKHDRKAEFRTVNARMSVNIPPVYSGPGRPRQAVLEMLDSMIMRYIPALRGVVLAHSNLVFLSDTASFLVDSPFAKVDINFTALIWSPEIGSRIRGTISICSPDHIGLLIHKTFNASIPRHHIPTGAWQFEYGALENDPAFGAAALGLDQDDAEDNGRWFHKDTGESIGGSSGEVEFTIVGLTVSQSMLSLLGSLQPDPFSPEHKPQPAISHPTTRKPRTKTNSEEEYSVANALADENSDEDDIFDSLKFEMRDFDDEEGPDDLEETVDVGTQPIHDAFAELGRETDKLSREVAREAKMEKKRRKEEKKLRKAQELEAAQFSPAKEAKKKKKDRA